MEEIWSQVFQEVYQQLNSLRGKDTVQAMQSMEDFMKRVKSQYKVLGKWEMIGQYEVRGAVARPPEWVVAFYFNMERGRGFAVLERDNRVERREEL